MRPILLAIVYPLCLFLSPSLHAADAIGEAEEALVELHKVGKLTDKAQYKTVRAAFARLFEARHGDVLRGAYGEDYEALTKWLDARPDLKQNLYTALDERYDRLPVALGLFRTLWQRWPKELEKHPDLGIAVAVVWDDPRGIYDYTGHQRRTKSTMPDKLADGPANFQYLIDNEKLTEGRLRFMPWEFLAFVVDQRTPLEERRWAKQYYQTHRASRSWHQDVPYDHDMLKGERNKASGLRPRLEGHAYTLENIRKYGGVCAQQADFAARVAKSVGVPAVFCWGASAYRGLHAWWMYVQITQGSADKLQFTLNSDGRYVGFEKDAFYTGHVTDPQTGRDMLDRDMERRLNLAGRDRVGKRHAALLMRAYSWLTQKQNWDVRQRVAFLDQVLQVCPQADEAWLAFAQLVRQGDLSADHKPMIRDHVSRALTTFQKYPDFVERLLVDLLPVLDPAEQVRFNQQAVAQCERVGRADLCCSARLRIADALAAQKKYQSAADGLVTTINRFPTEGRYVPKLTKKMQEVCGEYKGGNERLAKLYLDLVPKLAAYYGRDGLSTFARELYKQAMEFYEKNELKKYTVALKAQAGRLGGMP
jgi:hypothetical protein